MSYTQHRHADSRRHDPADLHAEGHDASPSNLDAEFSLPDRSTADAPPPLGSVDGADSDEDMDAGPGAAPAPAPSQPPGPILTHSQPGGDVVLFLGLPDVFTVGYDTLSFTARHFGGIRDVPAGPHFFWAAHPGGMSTRSGFWVVSSGADRVHAVRWDPGTELLGDAPAEQVPTDVDAFHGKLLSYRDPTAGLAAGGGIAAGVGSVGDVNEAQAAENEQIWGQMTSFVTRTLLSNVTGQAGGAWHVNTMDHVQGEVLLSGEREMEQRISNIRHRLPLPAARELRFGLDQHSKTYSAQRFGADRTLEATDSTSYITALLDDASSGVTEASLVGELQFAFVAGVHLGNEACLEQWWYMLLRLILKAYALPLSHPPLVADWLRVVTAQLTYGSEWLDTPITELSEAHSRELRLGLIIYKRRLEELLGMAGGGAAAQDGSSGGSTTAAQAAVAAAFSRLESVVAGAGYGWDIRGEYLRKGKVVMEDGEEVELEMMELQAEDERGEWAPEVVELDEHGRQKDLISWD